MIRIRQPLFSALVVAFSLTVSQSACADIVLSSTRIIYKAAMKDATIRMENKGERPLLVQSWFDTGDQNADPGSINVPFVATPPVSRVDAKQGQTVKVTYTGSQPLASDRESIFWFNVLEVPPKLPDSEAKGKNLLQLAFRTRIKLFYRPDGLEGTASEAPAKQQWQLRQTGGHAVIHITNPTPFYISFNSINLQAAGKRYLLNSSMIAPKSDLDEQVQGLSSRPASASIEYSAISDFGGVIKGNVAL
ncbi:fimbrial chaperone [Pseudocitrobacter cyperus]|uniref:Fimbrial chaperone n=1 Tax=Pseudocitrobacter cyperus TaxID=3112843 RepID=A0ABV0HHN3_9ENTR